MTRLDVTVDHGFDCRCPSSLEVVVYLCTTYLRASMYACITHDGYMLVSFYVVPAGIVLRSSGVETYTRRRG